MNATESWRGETALMWAAAENHAGVVTLLAGHGGDVNVRSRTLTFPDIRYNLATHATLPPPQGGFTALMFAARQGSLDAAQALADAGADLNVQDPDGTPALTMAIVNGHHDVARLLLERGANPNVAGCCRHDAAVRGRRTAHDRDVSRAKAAAQTLWSTWHTRSDRTAPRQRRATGSAAQDRDAALGPETGAWRRGAGRGSDTSHAGGPVRRCRGDATAARRGRESRARCRRIGPRC